MAQNKIVTSVSALTDNVITPTENVVCIDTRKSFIGVKKSQPQYEIDVSGTINSNILTIRNGAALTSITSNGINTNNIISLDISCLSIKCISGNFTNLTTNDLSCSSNFYVNSIRPYTNTQDISINGNIIINNSTSNNSTITNLTVKAIQSMVGSDISINGNIWIDGSLNISGNTSSVTAINSQNVVTGTITGGYLLIRSDDRLKHNEQNIKNALYVIRQLKPQIYQKTLNFKEIHYRGIVNEPYILEAGLIAQEVEQIDELKFSVISGNDETPYSINYNNIFIYCLAALKELDNSVETIKNVLNLNTQSQSQSQSQNQSQNQNNSTNHDLITIIENQNIQIQELVNKINNLENRINNIEKAF